MATKEHIYAVRAEKGRRKRAILIQELGGKCNSCGATENLHFDHIDPKSVKFRIGEFASKTTLKKLRKEAEKCQLLCLKCHWDKTIKERSHLRSTHGMTGHYTNHNCRCEQCKRAWANRQRAYMAARRLSLNKA